jgi:DNA-binding transcriptional MerR regulator
MVVLKDLFANKPTQAKQPGPSDIPTDKLISLKDQGLTVNQIYEALQRQGYSIDQISQAMNQADLKEGALAERGEKMPEGYPEAPPFGPPPLGRPSRPQAQMPNEGPGPMPPPGMPPMGMPAMQPMGGGGISEERIHEIAEAIIEEKWTELIENVNRIIEWKDSTESKINRMQQKMDDLQHSFDSLHEGVLGKISEYDKGMVDIGVEIKALEKVFQKILPGFMENVNELSRITAKMKGAKK